MRARCLDRVIRENYKKILEEIGMTTVEAYAILSRFDAKSASLAKTLMEGDVLTLADVDRCAQRVFQLLDDRERAADLKSITSKLEQL